MRGLARREWLRIASINLLVLAVLLFGFIVVCEIFLRVMDVPNPLDYDPFYRKSRIPGLTYELKPNFRGKGRYGSPVVTNSIGLRGAREFSERAPAGVIRVAVGGDSFAFGHGVPEEQGFVSKLQYLLDSASSSTEWEVMNLGVSGYTGEKILIALVEKTAAYSPQVLVYAVSQFDFLSGRDRMVVTEDGYISTSNAKFSGSMGLQTFLRRLRISYYIKAALLRMHAAGRTGDVVAKGVGDARWVDSVRPRAEGLVSKFAEVCRSRGIRCIVAWVSLTDPALDPLRLGAVVRGATEAEGLDFVSLEGLLATRELDDLVLSEFDMHPNPLAHGKIAEALCHVLAGVECPKVSGG